MLISRWTAVFLPLTLLAVDALAAPIAATNVRDDVLTEGTTSTEPSLAGELDRLTDYTGGFAAGDQSIHALFEPIGTTATAHLIVEHAYFENYNHLGIYNEAGDRAPIFYGSRRAGEVTEIQFLADGRVQIGRFRVYEGFGGGFGFYLYNSATGQTYYSQDGRNPDGDAHFLAFEQDGSVYFGFEDLTNHDDDYNDLVASVSGLRGVTPMPEPTAAVAFGIGLLVVRSRLRRR